MTGTGIPGLELRHNLDGTARAYWREAGYGRRPGLRRFVRLPGHWPTDAETISRRCAELEAAAGFARALPGHVYVVGFGPYVKIGFSRGTCKQDRVHMLSSSYPEPLKTFAVITGPMALERKLHQRFKHLRLNGEWFKREGGLAEWIAAGCPT